MTEPDRDRALPPEPRPGRVVVDELGPEVDGGRFPAKRTAGDLVTVTALVHADGHDALAAELQYRREDEASWRRQPMEPAVGDLWQGAFRVEELGRYRFRVEAWVDAFASWRRDLEKRQAADAVEEVHLQVGAALLREAAGRASGTDAEALRTHADALLDTAGDPADRAERALDAELLRLAREHPDRSSSTLSGERPVDVDRERGRFSTWYEMFPRSASPEPGRHGRFDDVIARLPYVSELGFDVLYLPPVHPIGRAERKGRNNRPEAEPGDVGSPWAIGAEEGGHDAIHPQLGTLDDFRRLIAEARGLGLEIAMDLAFQCAPDHPWVARHPEWFRVLPDGSVQYAENPPKKYQDIYPLHFEGEGWRELWAELRRVVLFWAAEGVRIFRVDNPHTKPYRFWEWLIAEVRRVHPEAIFLAEAFTRPAVMYALAKLGFSQSYTYFTWRNSKAEIVEYMEELTRGPAAEFFRPSFWPNTPDILPEPLQAGGPAAFRLRLLLAATLSASYGIYGPAFELCEAAPRAPGSEEYLDSEKYQLRTWDVDRSDSLAPLIARVNRIRRDNPALQRNDTLRFHEVDNDLLIAYSKSSPGGEDAVLAVVNLDPHHAQSGHVELDLEALGLASRRGFQMHDLVSGARYFWQGPRNYVQLDPATGPGHVFRVRRHTRSERDFDYYL